MPDTVSDGLFDVPDAADFGGGAHGGSAAPLAVRMRPANLDEVVGQDHLLQPGSPLRRLVEGSGMAAAILYGPPGSGKTTLASLISQATGRRFEALSALSAGVKEVRAVIDTARRAAAVAVADPATAAVVLRRHPRGRATRDRRSTWPGRPDPGDAGGRRPAR